MSNLVMVTADQLRFCQSGLAIYQGGVSCNKLSFHNGNAYDLLDNLILSAKVDPDEFTASVLATIDAMFFESCRIRKKDRHVWWSDDHYDEIMINSDPAPWLDEYMFEKIEGKWVQS